MILNRDVEFTGTITAKFVQWLGHPPNGDQLVAFLTFCRGGGTGDQIDAILSKEPESIAYKAKPPVPVPGPKPHLERRGNDFVDAQGQRVVRVGCDAFLAFRQWLDGGADALAPFVAESHELGFDTWRIFMMGSQRQNTVLELNPSEPRYYDQVRPFADYLAGHGIVPLLTMFVDAQDIMPNVTARSAHRNHMAELLAGGAVLWSEGNQYPKNGWSPTDASDPGGGLIWSRGSSTEDAQVPPQGASAAELHPTRVSWDRTLMDAAASPINMRIHGSGMVWMTEGMPFDVDSDPDMAWMLGRVYATCWALAILHDRQGQRGLLKTGRIRECADQFAKGMRVS